MFFLTFDDLLQIHALVLLRDGGADGLRDAGRLQAAVATQYQVVFGEELYPTLHTKAGAIVRGIIGDHPFSDGNKRTAMLAGLTLLEMNNYRVTAGPGQLEDFAVSVATDKPSVEDIASWLSEHSALRL